MYTNKHEIPFPHRSHYLGETSRPLKIKVLENHDRNDDGGK